MDGQQDVTDDPFAPIEQDDDDIAPDKDRVYWALFRGRYLAEALQDKERAYFETARNRGLIQLWVIAYAAHHGLTPQDLRDFATQQIGFEGNELENLRFHLNLTRSYTRRQSIMALGEKPAFKAMVVTSDHKSQAKAELADRVVNSLYTRYVEERDPEVAESDGVFGMGGAHYRWNFKGGDEVKVQSPVVDPATGQPSVNPETGEPLTHPVPAQSGAPMVTTVYPWQTPMETRASGDSLWVIVREAESKWDLIARFRDKEEDILKVNNSQDEYDFGRLFRLEELEYANADLITVKHFYHARCAAVPEGRYAVIVGDVVLWDGPSPVKTGLPVAFMRSGKFIETAFGYCDGWDMLAINQALNQVNSDELTNYANYGRQSTYKEKGTTVTADGLTKGTMYEFPSGAKPPGAVQLVAIPPTLNDLKAYLHEQLDLTSGQSATTRGEPEANVRSGEMAALLDSISLRYQSFRQQSARKYRIRGATIITDMIDRYSVTPFLVEIAGVENRGYVAEYTREDLSGIERIEMDVVSPLMQTVSGRLQMYLALKDLAPDQRAAAYELIASGDTSLFMAADRATELLIRRENEDLVTGEREVVPTAGEDAMKHYQKHWKQLEMLLASDDQDTAAIGRIHAHLDATVQTFLGMSPIVAGLRQIQGPPPIGPSPQNPAGNQVWQLQMLSGGGMAAAPPAANGNGGTPSGTAAGAGMPSADAGSAAQQNNQGNPQTHPSGTPLPQPSTPPGQ